jgi:hypothetical protein
MRLVQPPRLPIVPAGVRVIYRMPAQRRPVVYSAGGPNQHLPVCVLADGASVL